MKNEMNLDEIPTPETDALVPTQGNKQTMLEYIETLEAHARDLERRLTIARDEREYMGRLAYKNAAEAIECRRLLTIARDALWGVHETSSSSRLRRVAKETLALTAPKP